MQFSSVILCGVWWFSVWIGISAANRIFFLGRIINLRYVVFLFNFTVGSLLHLLFNYLNNN